ncbi:hypothetical protein [Gemelliphila palaticanis]|uniref:Helix-turn-helix domain-containing protein n=1 Tax=Gemelliphila palaticanis TaxID=81950 RepID=A0ABX2SXS2_9BACL|nr:hypothetical protein [Gemella palaticanis]MBF0714661.1 hypothetical protein [Gemella palaticanis]NYS46591.1 hypothetical protein [Gemella palaticanis]
MEVVLSNEYTKGLKIQLTNLIDEVIKDRLEKIQPTKRYYTQQELRELFKIGANTMLELQQQGLQYVRLGRKYYFDIEDVYSILETLKRQ